MLEPYKVSGIFEASNILLLERVRCGYAECGGISTRVVMHREPFVLLVAHSCRSRCGYGNRNI